MADTAAHGTVLKIAGPPPGLERPPLVLNQRPLGWMSDRIASIVEVPIRKTPRWWWIAFAISFPTMLTCFVMLTYLVSTGVGVWGLNQPVMWAWDITNFVFWIGIGHAGTLISAILFLLRQKWRTSINRAAEAMTLFAVLCAAIFPCSTRDGFGCDFPGYLIPSHANVIWPQFRSPLLWDVLRFRLTERLAALWHTGSFRIWQRCGTGPRPRCGSFYGLFALGWTGSNRHWSNYEKAYLILAGLSTPLVLSVHSIVSFDFAVSQVPGWHTTIFPPYFVAGAIFSGFGMVLTLLVPLRTLCGLEEVITVRHVELMCKVVLATGSIVGYAYGMEFFIAWYGGNPYELYAFKNRAFGPYWWAYWSMISCNVISPQLFCSNGAARGCGSCLWSQSS
jgi:molybdopterin-containing oxidoreductase family membrane subunit